MKLFKIKTWLYTLLLLLTVSCNKDTVELDGGEGEYTVTFNLNYEDKFETVKVAVGDAVKAIETPTRDGFTLENWCSDRALTSVWDFKTVVPNNMNLYAKWVAADGGDGDSTDDVAAQELAYVNDVKKTRPCIWTTNKERDELLETIATRDWAQTIVTKMKTMVDASVDQHMLDRSAVLRTIPKIQTDDNFTSGTAEPTAHSKILAPAGYAAVLYHITREQKYAVYATDVIMYYLSELSGRSQSQISIGGNYFYDPRFTYNWLAMSYDFLYNYLNYPGVERTYYSLEKNADVKYNNDVAQKALVKIARNTFNMNTDGTASPDNKKNPTDMIASKVTNHPILTAPGSLYPILCIDNTLPDSAFKGPQTREEMFKMFWETGSQRQASFFNSILPVYSEQGIWPESTSYSFMPAVPQVLNIVDRVFPEMNIFSKDKCKKMMGGSVLFDNLRNPNRRFVRYGDSKRNLDMVDDIYRIVLNIANRKGGSFDEYGDIAAMGLTQRYAAIGGYKPSLVSSGNDDGLGQLFWGEDLPEVSGTLDFAKTTVEVKHAGVILQRNHVAENNETYGLCGIIGGANYVHNHASGIAMELYGCGYIMAAAGGLAETLDGRAEPVHIEYFQHYAGNNTVVINGKSTGKNSNTWKGGNYLCQDNCQNFGAEPAHLADAINPNFNFGTQTLDDTVNSCDQQRTLGIVRTSPTTAYYVDVFRSKGNSPASRHDYIYHNLGTGVKFSNVDNGKEYTGADMVPTDFYDQTSGPVNAPGWNHFEKATTQRIAGEPTDATIKARFDVAGKYMHMYMAGGASRYYTMTTGPATREAKNPFDDAPTQIVVIRQNSDVWDQPYFVAFEPSESSVGSIQSVEQIENSSNKIIGMKVTSVVGNKTIEDIILNHATDGGVYTTVDIEFTGHYGIIRITSEEGVSTKDVELYLGSGKKLKYKNYEVSTTSSKGKKTQKWAAQTI